MNRFERVIAAIPDVVDGYRRGIAALGADSIHVAVGTPRKLDGSVDIDSCTKEFYPEANRWDYVISYEGKAFFLEVHPATGGMVKEMEVKLAWLKEWLRESAKLLEEYPSGSPRFIWIHSGKCGLSKTSPEYRKAAMMGLVPKRIFKLGA